MFSEINLDEPTPISWTNGAQHQKNPEPIEPFTNQKRHEVFQVHQTQHKNDPLKYQTPSLKFKNGTDQIKSQQKSSKPFPQEFTFRPINQTRVDPFIIKPNSPIEKPVIRKDIDIDQIDYRNFELYKKTKDILGGSIFIRLIFYACILFLIEFVCFNLLIPTLRIKRKQFLEFSLQKFFFANFSFSYICLNIARVAQVWTFYQIKLMTADFPKNYQGLVTGIFRCEFKMIFFTILNCLSIFWSIRILKNDLFYFENKEQQAYFSIFVFFVQLKLIFYDSFFLEETCFIEITSISSNKYFRSIKNSTFNHFLIFFCCFLVSIVTFFGSHLLGNDSSKTLNKDRSLESILTIVFITKLGICYFYTAYLSTLYTWSIRFFLNAKIENYFDPKSKFEDYMFVLFEIQTKNSNCEFENFKIEFDILTHISNNIDHFKKCALSFNPMFEEKSGNKMKNLKTTLTYFSNEFKNLSTCFEHHTKIAKDLDKSLFDWIYNNISQDYKLSIVQKVDLALLKLFLLNEIIYLNESLETCRAEVRELINTMELTRIQVERYLAVTKGDKSKNPAMDKFIRLFWNLDIYSSKLSEKLQKGRFVTGHSVFY